MPARFGAGTACAPANMRTSAAAPQANCVKQRNMTSLLRRPVEWASWRAQRPLTPNAFSSRHNVYVERVSREVEELGNQNLVTVCNPYGSLSRMSFSWVEVIGKREPHRGTGPGARRGAQ